MTKDNAKYLVGEIFGKQASEDNDIVDYYMSVNEVAMDMYAQKEAIAFKEWEDSSLEGKEWHKYDGHDTWINTYTMQVISTEQLYGLFLKDKK